MRLHACKVPPAEIEGIITQAVAKVGRARSATEIADAVRNSAPGNLKKNKPAAPNGARKAGTSTAATKNKAVIDQEMRQRVIDQSTLGGLEGLKRLSPVQELESKDADWFLEQLFPGDPLVCFGMTKDTFFTRPLSGFEGMHGAYQLVVPSPMKAPQGLTKDGKLSERCLDNVGPRHYLVTEFDGGTFDDQAAIIEHLSHFAPLTMVVFSGGKSLHAWWRCKGEREADIQRFFHYAEKLGADHATLSPVQLCRLPEGTRDGKIAQCVYYFNPANLVVGKEVA